VIDADAGVLAQDQHIASYVLAEGKDFEPSQGYHSRQVEIASVTSSALVTLGQVQPPFDGWDVTVG
jgi:hypothetical protein